MGNEFIKLLGVLVAVICFGVSIFQLLLALGLPLGEYAWGGKYKVLPGNLRISSGISFLIINCIGIIYLQNVGVVNLEVQFLNNRLFIWVFAVFFGFNSLGNLLSRSKKEKFVMSPLTIIATIASVIIAINL